MSARMYLDKNIQKMLERPVSGLVQMTAKKDYDGICDLITKLGEKDARAQYWVICIAQEKAILAKIFANGEDTDIILRDATDRVNRFGKKAYPLQDWQVEKIARSFVGWA